MERFIESVRAWWSRRKSEKSAKDKARRIKELRERYDIEVKDGNLWLTVSGETITNVPETWTTIEILAERERFIAAAMKKEGLSNEA